MLRIIEQTDRGKSQRQERKTIYNLDTDVAFVVHEINQWSQGTLLGWTTETGAREFPIVGKGGHFVTSEDATLYGLYQSQLSLSYDTNGTTALYDIQTKDCYHNASGESMYPIFTIRNAPVLANHTFVKWKVKNGSVVDLNESPIEACMPKDNIQLQTDAELLAVWDQHPIIEAYNRYFTLEEAKNGKITEMELLKKVIATDAEDGVLENGVDVKVKDFHKLDFTNAIDTAKIPITYEAKDSIGNVVTKTVIVGITDTTMKKSSHKIYIRFISCDFFLNEDGTLLGADKGGVEETSIWRRNEHYRNLLMETLQNTKINGVWKKSEETYTFTYEELKEMKNPSEQ